MKVGWPVETKIEMFGCKVQRGIFGEVKLRQQHH